MKTILLLFLCGVCSAAGYQNFLGNSGVIDPFVLNNTIRDLHKNKLDITSASETYVKKTDIGSIYAVVLTTNTGGVEGQTTSIAHGLDYTKIVGITAALIQGVNDGYLPSYASGFNLIYNISYSATVVYVTLHATDSGNLLNKPVKITVFYTE